MKPHRPLMSTFDSDGRRRAHVGGSQHACAQFFAGFLLQDVQVSVAAYLEHFRAHLHAGAGTCAHIEVDCHLHAVPLVLVGAFFLAAAFFVTVEVTALAAGAFPGAFTDALWGAGAGGAAGSVTGSVTGSETGAAVCLACCWRHQTTAAPTTTMMNSNSGTRDRRSLAMMSA